MRSLDEFYRYIERQERAVQPPLVPGEQPAMPEKTEKPEKPFGGDDRAVLITDRPVSQSADKANKREEAPVPAGVSARSNEIGEARYVIRNGMTVLVRPGAVAPPSVLPLHTPARPTLPLSPITGAPRILRETRADYLPPIVEAKEPTQVADPPTHPQRSRQSTATPVNLDQLPLPHRNGNANTHAATHDNAVAGGERDKAALWGQLPRHLQLLVEMAAEETEEVAANLPGMRETRRQLIDRLLDPTLTLEDTARVLGVCQTTVRRYTNKGILPHHRTPGQQRRFRLSDVLAFHERTLAGGNVEPHAAHGTDHDNDTHSGEENEE